MSCNNTIKEVNHIIETNGTALTEKALAFVGDKIDALSLETLEANPNLQPYAVAVTLNTLIANTLNLHSEEQQELLPIGQKVDQILSDFMFVPTELVPKEVLKVITELPETVELEIDGRKTTVPLLDEQRRVGVFGTQERFDVVQPLASNFDLLMRPGFYVSYEDSLFETEGNLNTEFQKNLVDTFTVQNNEEGDYSFFTHALAPF